MNDRVSKERLERKEKKKRHETEEIHQDSAAMFNHVFIFFTCQLFIRQVYLTN